MAGKIIDELWIMLGLDGSKALNEANKTAKGITNSLKSVTSVFTGFTAGLTGLFAIANQFSDWTTKSIEIQNQARSINKSMEEVQAWGSALAKYGGNIDSFTTSVRYLNGELVKMSATGVSRAGKILSEGYGIDVGEVGRLRDFDDVLGDIADVMSKMSVEEAMGLGSKVGLDASMVQVARQGREAMKDLIEQKKRDAIYTEEDAETVREYNAAMKQLSIGTARIANVFFRTIVPAFSAITRAVGDFVKYLLKHETAIKAFFIMLTGLIIGLLLPSILTFFSALLTNPITWIILLLGLLAIAIDDLVGWANGKKSAFGDFWTAIFGSPKEALQTFEDVKTGFMEFVNFMKTDGKEIAKPFIDLGKWLLNLSIDNLKSIVAFIRAIRQGNIFDVLTAGVTLFIKTVFGSLRVAINLIGTLLQQMTNVIITYMQEAISTSKAFFEGYIQYLISAFSACCEAVGGFFAGLRDNIISLIGEAIDWAIGKLGELAAAVRATPIIGGAIDYVMGGSGGSSSTVNTKIGQITVNTQATDANGIASSMGGAVNRKFSPAMANGGVIQ